MLLPFLVLLLVLVTAGVAAIARTRGGNPWLWGSLCVAGYLLITFVGGFMAGTLGYAHNEGVMASLMIAPWIWIGGVAFCARFLVGASKPKPDGMWSCPHCRYLNQHYAVVCDACQQPYGTKPKPAVPTNT